MFDLRGITHCHQIFITSTITEIPQDFERQVSDMFSLYIRKPTAGLSTSTTHAVCLLKSSTTHLNFIKFDHEVLGCFEGFADETNHEFTSGMISI